MKDKITLSWGKAAAYNLCSVILIGHFLSHRNAPFEKTESKKKKKRKKERKRKKKKFMGNILIWN